MIFTLALIYVVVFLIAVCIGLLPPLDPPPPTAATSLKETDITG